ncbi:hypothetical protein H5410_030568 [Solanum commersonii]|uniref:Uncharacterized protein n=1 Tax=Solanum commersonii TaxID=4109 RepID=A0A9J5YJQ7_SOLCO|nr:hypothetical protein H5410_030568 [Solanum commersonii]
MARTRTSVSGDQEPIHVGDELELEVGQVPIATQGHDRTVPPDADVIHKDVQDHIEGDGPTQAPPSIIATLVL